MSEDRDMLAASKFYGNNCGCPEGLGCHACRRNIERLAEFRRQAREEGAAEERAAVVAWLRDWAGDVIHCVGRDIAIDVSDCVERCEHDGHRKGGDHG